MIYLAGIGIAIFLAILLLSKRNKSWSDKILTGWMFFIGLHLASFYLYYSGAALTFPTLIGIGGPFPLFHGVFLYLYVGSLTNQLPARRWLIGLHLVPILLAYALLGKFLLLSAEQKMEVFRSRGAGFETVNTILLAAIVLSGVFYISWSAILLRRHERNIRDQFSALENVNLRWLQVLTYGLGAIWILVLFLMQDALIYTGVVIFVFLIGFFGVRQTTVFSHGRVTPPEPEKKEKYQKSGLSEETASELHRTLIRVMKEDAPYKRPELSIDDLAETLGVHPNYLSQVINQKEQKNFYDFVNGYRIEEFKRSIAMHKNRQFTLLSLAYECGFSSKSSFNRCFRKATGQTPSEYASSFLKDFANPA